MGTEYNGFYGRDIREALSKYNHHQYRKKQEKKGKAITDVAAILPDITPENFVCPRCGNGFFYKAGFDRSKERKPRWKCTRCLRVGSFGRRNRYPARPMSVEDVEKARQDQVRWSKKYYRDRKRRGNEQLQEASLQGGSSSDDQGVSNSE